MTGPEAAKKIRLGMIQAWTDLRTWMRDWRKTTGPVAAKARR
jgi:hypothetical protein